MAKKKKEREYVKAIKVDGVPAIVALARLKEELDDPRDVLKQIGILLVTQTRMAFINQGPPGGGNWLKRYPSQSSPKLNVAGALGDFANGASEPQAMRFQDSPVLRNTGKLQGEWNTSNPADRTTVKNRYTVVVGTSPQVASYAGRMQYGGKSSMDITEGAKTNLGEYLKGNSDNVETVREKMGWMLNKKNNPTKLVTDVVPRTFLEIVPATERKIKQVVEKFITRSMKTRG